MRMSRAGKNMDSDFIGGRKNTVTGKVAVI
jgi:hypothetical protein